MGKRLLVLVTTVCALCLVLVGCGGGGNQYDEAAKKNFVGLWEFIEMQADENGITAEDAEEMKSFGITAYLELKDDHTGSFEVFGTPTTFTWEAKGETLVGLTFDDSVDSLAEEGEDVAIDRSQDISIEDDKLVMEDETGKMLFKKIDPADKIELPEDGEGVEVVPVDDEGEIDLTGDSDGVIVLEEDAEDGDGAAEDAADADAADKDSDDGK